MRYFLIHNLLIPNRFFFLSQAGSCGWLTRRGGTLLLVVQLKATHQRQLFALSTFSYYSNP